MDSATDALAGAGRAPGLRRWHNGATDDIDGLRLQHLSGDMDATQQLSKVRDLLVTQGDFEQGRRLADEVLQNARRGSDAKVGVDAQGDLLRSIVLCERCRGSSPRYKESSQRKAIFAEVEKMCREELPALREREDLRGEAVMVLSAVEMLLESRRLPETRRGNKKRQEARLSVEKAVGTFQDLKETEWEAWLSRGCGSQCQGDEWCARFDRRSVLGELFAEALLVLSSACLAQNDFKEAADPQIRAKM
eukprot:Skav224670  [mRNA]  locus=scaffold4044:76438:91106:- [translate_table: standard]